MLKQKSFFLLHIFFGVVFTFLGIFAFLAQLGKEYFLPLSLFSSTFLEVMIIFVGLFFIREAVRNKDSQERFVHFTVGLGLFFIAILPLFVYLGILKFLPYYIDLEVSNYILSVLLIGAGFYMIVDRILLLMP